MESPKFQLFKKKINNQIIFLIIQFNKFYLFAYLVVFLVWSSDWHRILFNVVDFFFFNTKNKQTLHLIMDGFGDNFDQVDVDPAAEFLAREKDQLGGLADDVIAPSSDSAVNDSIPQNSGKHFNHSNPYGNLLFFFLFLFFSFILLFSNICFFKYPRIDLLHAYVI